MAKGKGWKHRQSNYPAHYTKNRINNVMKAERRYLTEGKTKEKHLNELCVNVTEILGKHYCAAMMKDFGVSESKLSEVTRSVDDISRWYTGMKKINGIIVAVKALKESVKDILPDTFWIPDLIDKAEDEKKAMKDAAELTARIYCKAINNVLGYDKEKIGQVFRTARQMYRESVAASESC